MMRSLKLGPRLEFYPVEEGWAVGVQERGESPRYQQIETEDREFAVCPPVPVRFLLSY